MKHVASAAKDLVTSQQVNMSNARLRLHYVTKCAAIALIRGGDMLC